MATVIVSDPGILGGRQVFRAARVPVEALFENLEDGLTLDERDRTVTTRLTVS